VQVSANKLRFFEKTPQTFAGWMDTLLLLPTNLIEIMGRGDKKTAKGKRSKGSFGVSRSKSAIKAQMKRAASKKTAASPAAEAPVKAKRTVKKKEA
jgi:ribosomal small subunit protein bTHX